MTQLVKLIIIALLALVGMEQAEARSAAAVTAVGSLLPCDPSETTCAMAPASSPATASARLATLASPLQHPEIPASAPYCVDFLAKNFSNCLAACSFFRIFAPEFYVNIKSNRLIIKKTKY